MGGRGLRARLARARSGGSRAADPAHSSRRPRLREGNPRDRGRRRHPLTSHKAEAANGTRPEADPRGAEAADDSHPEADPRGAEAGDGGHPESHRRGAEDTNGTPPRPARRAGPPTRRAGATDGPRRAAGPRRGATSGPPPAP
ncbi:hypothetical protein GCM10010317_042130 [Streptomyces mirabilis]|nr:hypothetical protein GCM10010317_042130 [Streptomyces mirabilis]